MDFAEKGEKCHGIQWMLIPKPSVPLTDRLGHEMEWAQSRVSLGGALLAGGTCWLWHPLQAVLV